MRPLHVVLSVPRPPEEVMARVLEGVTAEYGVTLRNTKVRVSGFVRTTEAGSVVVARYSGWDGGGEGWKIALLGLYGASHIASAGGSWLSLFLGSIATAVTLVLVVGLSALDLEVRRTVRPVRGGSDRIDPRRRAASAVPGDRLAVSQRGPR